MRRSLVTAAVADVAVIGGGIVGLAAARALQHRVPGKSVAVLEAEDALAAHQTGHNSGVIHSGLYYKPGSLKAANCVRGRTWLYEYCREKQIPHDRCGKVVVAVNEAQVPALDELERRGRANGLEGIRRLPPEGLREYEPHVQGVDGLFVPHTGIVDFAAVARAYGEDIEAAGGAILRGFRVDGLRRDGDRTVITAGEREQRARFVVNCAGLHSDRVARLAGIAPAIRIIPFRGEYMKLSERGAGLVRNLIYPVPDPRFPFLGVHFTRMIQGGVEAGPNAVLAFAREGYRHRDIRLRDIGGMMSYRGFWRMAGRYWRQGAAEFRRSLSHRAFVRALQELIPEVQPADVHPHGAGVRAQAVQPNGKLADDFVLMESPAMLHVLNAPSPAATASLSIGHTIADRVAAMV